MKLLILWLASATLALSAATEKFIADAAEKHGAFGAKAARFLVEHMPATDRENLTAEFLNENLDLALKARCTFPSAKDVPVAALCKRVSDVRSTFPWAKDVPVAALCKRVSDVHVTFPWAKDVPEEIFLNDVLPYAVFDEPRDPWRADFLEKATPLVKDAKTASEAAQILNRDFFKLINTHYNTKRKRTNQSPKESIEQGKATCTGLSIILVDACRAIGIPARAVGTPLWIDDSGNHTWVEIWDDGWHFTGADEYTDKGLNHGWFVKNASKADASDPVHSIYATSWKKDGGHFPLVWSPKTQSVGGINVTERYQVKSGGFVNTVGVRFFDDAERVAKAGKLTTAAGYPLADFETKAGTADLNDTARIVVDLEKTYRLRFEIGGKPQETQPFLAAEATKTIQDIRAADLKPVPDLTDENAALSKELAPRAIQLAFETLQATQKKKRAAELKAKSITIGEHTMKWLEKTFGKEPDDGRSLWISMHGGGGAPPAVNEQQWHNQIKLYQPKEGIYLAPRAPTDTWNLWHQDHIDPLFARLIEDMVALRNVNPDKIYLMGYSAGGDGVWQLAPRMADRFAAASMMAGHPNESSLLGLRNLPFAIFMGENDAAHKRNTVAAEKTAEMEALHKADPEGYIHLSRIYPGLGHWMELKDAESLPWMAKFTRDPWPKKIVWFQDDVTHERYYWLQLPKGTAEKGRKIVATVDGQKIHLEGEIPKGTKLLLSDKLLDLDQPVSISINDAPPREFKPTRNLKTILEALTNRLDPSSTPTATIVIE